MKKNINVPITLIISALLLGMLAYLPLGDWTNSHAMPDKELIEKILYENKQIYMKNDIMYKLKRKEFIKRYGMKKWEDFISRMRQKQGKTAVGKTIAMEGNV